MLESLEVVLLESRSFRIALRSSVAALLITVGAFAVTDHSSAQADPLAVVAGETLDVKADKLDVDIVKGTVVLEGGVRAKMGELEVLCPKVEIRYDEAPKVRWAKGSGGVRARMKGIEAAAQSFEVDVACRTFKLGGGVRLTRGKGWVTADNATIDIATRKVTLNDVKGSIPVEPPAR
jgi:lipopolysaccharide export system protein LptA